jgi:peptide/nickel transport system substrate-binding protein
MSRPIADSRSKKEEDAHMSLRLLRLLGLMLVLLSFGAAGCATEEVAPVEPTEVAAPTEPPAAPEPAGNVAEGGSVSLRMLFGDWDTLDPHKTRVISGYQIALALYDRLVSVDAAGNVVPALAESWTLSADSISLVLKSDVTCADGTPLTASAVATSLERMGAPETEAPYTYRTIGKAGYSVTADDAARTVSIELNAPHSDLLLGLAMPWASIVCPAGLEDPESMTTAASGSGPYTLEESVRGDSYTLVARTDYEWGPDYASPWEERPESIILRVVDNDTTAANMLLGGELNIAAILGRDVERVAADSSLFNLVSLGVGSNGLVFNQAEGRITQDPAVRHALMLAVDAEAWNQAETAGTGRAMTTLYTPNMFCFDPDNGNAVPGYDPAEARRVLEEAGWTANAEGVYEKDGQPLEVYIVGYEDQLAGNEYLLEAYTAVGVAATMDQLEWNTWIEQIFTANDWDVNVQPYGSVMPSPSIYAGQVGEGNFAGFHNAKYIEYSDAAFASDTLEEACNNWLVAESALFEAFDVKPTNVPTYNWFGNNVEFGMLGVVVDPLTIRTGN